MRLIDADELQSEYKKYHDGKRSVLIDVAPTIDAVEVVRCRDCIHWFFCRDPLNREPDDFCSDGERVKE